MITAADPNTLMIGLLVEGKRCGCLVKLRRYNNELDEVAEHVGCDPWLTLAAALEDVAVIKAKQCIIFSNAGTAPQYMPYDHRKTWFSDRGILKFDKGEVELFQIANKSKFTVLHQLIKYDRWRYVEVTADQLKSTRRLLE